MVRKCAICTHSERPLINQAIIGGEAERIIAEQFCLSASAVHRHKGHIQDLITQDHTAQADDVIGQIRELQEKTLSILQAAEAKQDSRVALQAIKEARANFELIARLTGQLQEKLSVDNRQITIHYINDWRTTTFVEKTLTE